MWVEFWKEVNPANKSEMLSWGIVTSMSSVSWLGGRAPLTQTPLLQACELLQKPAVGTTLLGFQGCLHSRFRTPALLISILGSYSNLASLLTTWFQFFSQILIRVFLLHFLMLFLFFFSSHILFCRLFGNIPACLTYCPVPYVWKGSS